MSEPGALSSDRDSTETSDARPALSWRTVSIAFASSLLLALGFAFIIYLSLIRYERVAARHLPPDTTAAVRVDVEKVVLFEPVRKHLVPLANEFEGPRSRFDVRRRLDRIQGKSGLELAVDLREIVVARGPTFGDWVVVLGGRFPRRGVIEILYGVLRSEGYLVELAPDLRSLTWRSGISFGQADDGCLIAASSPSRLAQALPAGDASARLGMRPDGPGAFALSQPVLRELGELGASRAAELGTLGSIERVSGTLALGHTVTIQARLEFSPGKGDPDLAETRARAVLAAVAGLVQSGPDRAGERRLLEHAELRTAGPNLVEVRTDWERSDVDRAAKTLAEALRAAARR